jgi:hypothetical protein
MAETTNMIPLTNPAMRLGKILEYFESSAMFNAQDKQKYNHMFNECRSSLKTGST